MSEARRRVMEVDLLLLRMGQRNLVVVSSSELAMEVLHTHGVEFRSREAWQWSRCRGVAWRWSPNLAVEVLHTNAPPKMDLLLLCMTRLASAWTGQHLSQFWTGLETSLGWVPVNWVGWRGFTGCRAAFSAGYLAI